MGIHTGAIGCIVIKCIWFPPSVQAFLSTTATLTPQRQWPTSLSRKTAQYEWQRKVLTRLWPSLYHSTWFLLLLAGW